MLSLRCPALRLELSHAPSPLGFGSADLFCGLRFLLFSNYVKDGFASLFLSLFFFFFKLIYWEREMPASCLHLAGC